VQHHASAGAQTEWRPPPPAWSENGAWLLFGILSCGLFVWAGFMWIGSRYGRADWWRWAAFYGGCAALTLLITSWGTAVDDGTGTSVWQDVFVVPYFVLLAGVVHQIALHVQQTGQRRAALLAGRALPGPMRYGPPSTYRPVAAQPHPQPMPAPPPPPPPAAPEPWAGFVRSAEQARVRFRAAAARVRPGPLYETIEDLAARIDASVGECRRIATRGKVLAEARAGIDTARLDQNLAAAEARHEAEPDDERDAGTVVALRSQRATAERLDRVIEDTIDQLRLLDARFGDAVARMLELSAQAEIAARVPELSGDIDGLLTDLEALRLAVEETEALDVVGDQPV
jgi:hypothetical protein